MPKTAEKFIAELQQKLRTAIQKADELFPKNPQFTFDQQGKAHLKQLKSKAKPKGFKAFRKKVHKLMPERNLLDVLKDVHYWSDFTKHFSPPSEANSKMSDAISHYLFTVFGYGCNLGPAQTAKHTEANISLRTIKRVNDQHVTAQKLQAASTDIINQYAAFDLPFLWGTGKTTAADGTHIPLRKNNLLGEQHIRYGGYGGIAYHHISDTYIALFCNFIACGIWEAVYILDGLLKNKSKLQPDTIHADTQGQNEPVFGLSYLLGIKLMPRIRNWNDVNFYRVDEKDHYQNIDQLFTDTIKWKLIHTHWKDLMQVVISIQKGKVLPSMILQKLGTDNRKNKLYKAFRELGRVIRTIFLLQYVNSTEIRQKIHAATCKIESFHAFHDWVTFGGQLIKAGDPVQQLKQNQYISLIANAVMLHNVADLTTALNQLTREKETVTPEFVKHLSPYITKHIKRFGLYVLDLDDLPEPIESKKLNLIC